MKRFVENCEDSMRKLGGTVLADRAVDRPSDDSLAEIAVLKHMNIIAEEISSNSVRFESVPKPSRMKPKLPTTRRRPRPGTLRTCAASAGSWLRF